MGTQLIMTVGTNPLPVWVAWHHLKQDVLEPPVNVRLIYTPGTMDEKKRLETYCDGAYFFSPICTSPGAPGNVREDVEVVLNDLSEFTHLHVHYTGGTKVMAVETVAALEYGISEDGINIHYNTSYLDPRSTHGPAIVDSYGRTLGPDDARQNIPANLQQIANLNGFTLAPFTHEYYDKAQKKHVKKDLPEPAILDEEKETKGKDVLLTMKTMKKPWSISINSTHFEYAAYVALKQALKSIQAKNPNRKNYQIFHEVYIRRTGANQQDANFELDVVALLGYQIVVISCTLKNEKEPIKEKGMEVILRARQLGGDEAQAIVLCPAHPNDARRVQEELHDEVGSVGAPLRVWGTDKWCDLSNELLNYLRADLHWL